MGLPPVAPSQSLCVGPREVENRRKEETLIKVYELHRPGKGGVACRSAPTPEWWTPQSKARFSKQKYKVPSWTWTLDTQGIICLWKLLSRVRLCNPMDWSLPGSSVHGIIQDRKLEWVNVPFSRGSSQPRNWTQVSHIAGRFFTVWDTREAQLDLNFRYTRNNLLI